MLRETFPCLSLNTFLHQEREENNTAHWRSHDFTVNNFENSSILIFLWHSRVSCMPFICCHIRWLFSMPAFVSSFKDSVLDATFEYQGHWLSQETSILSFILCSQVVFELTAGPPVFSLGITAVELLSVFFASVCF